MIRDVGSVSVVCNTSGQRLQSDLGIAYLRTIKKKNMENVQDCHHHFVTWKQLSCTPERTQSTFAFIFSSLLLPIHLMWWSESSHNLSLHTVVRKSNEMSISPRNARLWLDTDHRKSRRCSSRWSSCNVNRRSGGPPDVLQRTWAPCRFDFVPWETVAASGCPSDR